MTRPRLRDLGITIGSLPTGRFNAITDVPDVWVGHTTLVHDTPRVRAHRRDGRCPSSRPHSRKFGLRRLPFLQRLRRDDRYYVDRGVGAAHVTDCVD